MFSARLPWLASPNSINLVLEKRRANHIPTLDLTQSNPTQADFEYPADTILPGFQDPRILRYDPDSIGLWSAREQLALLEGVDVSRVFLTASTSEAYAWLFKLLANPGDEILTPAPSYPLFSYLAALESVNVAHYPLHYDHGWYLDLAGLELKITKRTRAVVIVNPNNPTGSYLKRSEAAALLTLCRERSLALISDEVFSSYALTGDPERVSTLNGVDDVLTFCLNGLSKLAGMPQMKLGWFTVGGPPELRGQALQNLELIADTYLSVGTPVQYALPALLAARVPLQAQIRARLAANLGILREALQRAPCASLLDVEGGWSAILRVPRVHSEEQWVLQLLEKEGVLVQPGYFYDFESEAFLVVSLLTPPATFKEGVQRLSAALNANS